MTGRIVITGGAGFLGTALARRLRSDGDEVCVLDLPDRLTAVADLLAGVETRPFAFPDITGIEQAFTGATALVHMACTTTPASSMTDMARDAAENIAPSVAIFQAAGQAGISRVIFASSGGTVYGDPKTLPVPENAAGGALSGYGVSKLAIENYLRLVAGKAGFTGISLRIGNPYGRFQLRGATVGIIANYLRHIHAGRAPEVWGDGSVVRDYIHIDDVTSAICIALAAPELSSGSYNIGSGTGYSINDIFAAIRRVTGTDLALRYKPARGFDVDAIVLDTTEFRRVTRWSPQVGLETGITELWNILRERKE
ncbi:NAD-dependent epimerase/dehydratase family protein [Paracoccus onubensis]|uniref:NAD-dependent epimerase/dehydratase family protein n=1 Tax=Paracoccus onubensis TaxID=1675788 RepID=UPI0027309888|nr:NAD-dependent epimerase/dehydratase family protein [Paracoccus onubensis]MDP0928013.1 NAD-dependent epimerase/dehydratase family protein [Paracoccus onubensis]